MILSKTPNMEPGHELGHDEMPRQFAPKPTRGKHLLDLEVMIYA